MKKLILALLLLPAMALAQQNLFSYPTAGFGVITSASLPNPLPAPGSDGDVLFNSGGSISAISTSNYVTSTDVLGLTTVSATNVSATILTAQTLVSTTRLATGSISGTTGDLAVNTPTGTGLRLQVNGTTKIFTNSNGVTINNGNTGPGSGAALDVLGIISSTGVSVAAGVTTTRLTATSISVTNLVMVSSTLLTNQALFVRSNTLGLLVDGTAGFQYDPVTDRSMFAETDLPASITPSSTVHISGTLRVTSATFLTGLTAGTATNNLCITSVGQIISSTTLSGCLGVSDPALKKDIRISPYGLAEVMAVDTVTYKDIRPGGSAATQIGFLAYSVDRDGQRYRGLEAVMPELVDPKATYYNGQYYKGVVYERAIVVAYKAIQQQQAQIEALKAAVDELRHAKGLPPLEKPFWKFW